MTDDNKHALKLTNQFRNGRGMVFAFRYNKEKLTLCLSPRENEMDAEDWCAEGRTGAEPRPQVIREWGATRADALRELGRSWASRASSESLPIFDWEAVTSELNAVRAL
jgi:hypothetical protein